MSIFDKLFKTKVEDIMQKAKRADALLSQAEKEIAELQASPRRILIREEMIKLIGIYGDQNYRKGMRRASPIEYQHHDTMEQLKIYDTECEIKDLLNEICKE